MFRVAMLSKWHVHAAGYAQMFANAPGVEIAAVWDEDAARGKKWAEELGVPFFADVDELLAREDVDAVSCCAPTSMHTELLIKAAYAGKHIFTEKVATLTAAEGQALKAAVEANKVIFTISFPQRTTPDFLYAKKLIEEGALGDVTMLRVRNGHDGATANWLPNYWYNPETTGGGAMMDLGCHPMYLSRWLMGEAECITTVLAHYTYRQVEDSAACTIRFKNSAIGIVESTLAAAVAPYLMEIYGTKGTFYFNGDGSKVAINGSKELVPAEIPEDCKNVKSPLEQFIDSCVNGTPVLYGIDDALALTELMDAAYRSADEERTVYIDELYDEDFEDFEDDEEEVKF